MRKLVVFFKYFTFHSILLFLIIPVLAISLYFEDISKYDAQKNGKLLDVTIKNMNCGGKKGGDISVLHEGKLYSLSWSCNLYNEKIGDTISVKYSDKYDSMVKKGYKQSAFLRYFRYVFLILFSTFYFRYLYGKTNEYIN